MIQDTLLLNDCPECANAGGVFNLTCPECRTRLAVSEPCKLTREVLVKGMEKWGSTKNWDVEPNCGCKGLCERMHAKRTKRGV